MSRLAVCAVRDRQIDTFTSPHFAVSAGAAVRNFTDLVNQAGEQNPYYRHPGDFELYQLGWFEDLSGQTENLPMPVQLCVAENVAIR